MYLTYDSCSAVQANHTAQWTLDPPILSEPMASLDDTAFQVQSCIASSTGLLARSWFGWVLFQTQLANSELFALELQGEKSTAAPVTRHLPLLVSTQQAKPGPADSEGTVPVTVAHVTGVFWMHTMSSIQETAAAAVCLGLPLLHV